MKKVYYCYKCEEALVEEEGDVCDECYKELELEWQDDELEWKFRKEMEDLW